VLCDCEKQTEETKHQHSTKTFMIRFTPILPDMRDKFSQWRL